MKPMLWIALVGTVAAAVFVSSQESSDVEPVVRGPGDARSASRQATTPASTPSAKSSLNMTLLGRSLNDWATRRQVPQSSEASASALALRSGDLVAWASQQPPPPPPPPPYKPPPPPPPMAPAFSHAWVGRYVDNADRAVIAGASQTWVVKVGDVMDGQWRVDAIGERQMTLTYLPLMQTKTVSMK